MADCTTPGGKCYEDGRSRTGNAISDILKVNLYMAECARLKPGESGPGFDAFLERCVGDKLASSHASDATPTPAPVPTPEPTR
jgi:hypothetical protein